jgi:hypothetical protein
MASRFLGILLNSATILSLLLFAATAAGWILSYNAGQRVGLITLGERYTLHSDRGRLTLTGPPAATPAEEKAAWEVISAIRNDQFFWMQSRFPGSTGTVTIHPTPVIGSPAGRATGMIPQLQTRGAPAGMRRALLRALEDPDKFLAGHCLLLYAETPRRMGLLAQSPSPRPWRSFDLCLPATTPSYGVVTFDGLRVEFRRQGAVIDDSRDHDTATERRVPTIEFRSADSWRFDAAQLPTIRDQWHDRLDVTAGSMPYWPLLVPFLVLPVAQCRASWRRARRRRAGQCLACGYDVRATPDRCPECGAVPSAR